MDVRLQANVVAQADFSANKPTIPVVGQPFAASGPYASYVLLATVPASITRTAVEIQNQSTGIIAIVRDDVSASVGSTPMDVSVFALGPATATGAQGPSYYSQTCAGRYQIYAASSGAQVAIFSD
jgi:hypothetical protein